MPGMPAPPGQGVLPALPQLPRRRLPRPREDDLSRPRVPVQRGPAGDARGLSLSRGRRRRAHPQQAPSLDRASLCRHRRRRRPDHHIVRYTSYSISTSPHYWLIVQLSLTATSSCSAPAACTVPLPAPTACLPACVQWISRSRRRCWRGSRGR